MKYNNVTSVDVVYSGREKNIATINLWVREGRNRYMKNIEQPFYPYFYIPKENFKELHYLETNGIHYISTVPNKKSVFGEELLKIELTDIGKKGMAALKDKFSKTYEYDLKYEKRFLLDNEINYTDNYRVCFFDIETDMSLDIDNTPKKVTSIALYDNFTEKYIMLMLDENVEKFKVEDIKGTKLLTYPSEYGMLEGFINYIKEYRPDILTAYNLNNFDMPYLYNRMKKLGINPNEMAENLRGYNFKSTDGMHLTHLGGIELIDYFDLVQKLYKDDPLENFKLDTVGKAIVGLEKITYKDKYKDIKEMYEKNKNLFIEYNLRDVEILVEIEKKMKLISGFLVSTQKLVGCNLKDIFNNSVSLDFFMLKTFKNEFIFPTKEHHEHKKIIGALSGVIQDSDDWKKETKAPPYKLYKNIGVVDFAALYPNLIRTFNLSPEMKTKGKGVTIDGVTFSQDKKGILPRMVDILIGLKKQYGDKKKTVDPNSMDFTIINSIYMGVKGLINSLYGVFVFPGFRMYDHDVGKSITISARMMLLKSYDFMEKEGYEVIYGDTDSLFFITKKDDVKEAIKEVDDDMIKLNEHLGKLVTGAGCKESYLFMDFEKRFSKVVFMGVKKRYIGLCDIWDGKDMSTDEKFVVKGYDLKRSEIPNVIKDRIKEIILLGINQSPYEQIEKVYKELVDYIITADIKDIAWSKGLNKVFHTYKVFASQYKGALTAKKYLKLNYKQGDKPRFFYIKPGYTVLNPITNKVVKTDIIAFDKDTVIPVELENKFDRMKYIKKYVDDKLKPFTKVEEMEINKLVGYQSSRVKAYDALMQIANGE